MVKKFPRKQNFLGRKIFYEIRISEEDKFSMKLKLPDSVKGSSISNHRKLNILGPFHIKLSFLGRKFPRK